MERMNEENVEEDRHFALLSKSISASREGKGISEHLQGLISTQGRLRRDDKNDYQRIFTHPNLEFLHMIFDFLTMWQQHSVFVMIPDSNDNTKHQSSC